MFFSPIDGDRKLPSVAARDIAAAASRLLLDDSCSGTGEVPLLGPGDLSFNLRPASNKGVPGHTRLRTA
jgi:hypothetical protein